MSVVIETTVGDLTVDLFIEDRPLACLNFIKLCKLKYYNYNLFHTIEQDFIAQTGDPTGAGDGGTSVWGVIEGPQKRFFEAESLPKLLHTSVGLLSFVSPGKHLVGSQFFFTLGADLTSLDGQHCVIGEVVEGHETLRRLNEAIVDDKFRPYQDIRITHTVILEDPFPDMRGFRAPSRSPSPTPERLQNGRIAADEDIDDTEGKTMEEIQEMLAEREAKARATILEIVGDLPDAEAAPPENVLFVCKLNPVTTEDDLEIIFSRFGKVVSCEVIRDKKSGDSLQYAFVEFDSEKSCEAAYFKMNNVLIDDRRIHVDFSQSVARVKWRGKGRGVDGPQGRLDFKNLREADSNNRQDAEERRKAREQRHRDQEKNYRNHSRARSPKRRRENGTCDRQRSGKDYQERLERDRERNTLGRRHDSPRQNRKDYNARSKESRYENKNRERENSNSQRRDEYSNNRRRQDIQDKSHKQYSSDRKRNEKSSYEDRRQEVSDRGRSDENSENRRKVQISLERRNHDENRGRATQDNRRHKDSPYRSRRQQSPDKRPRKDSTERRRREKTPEKRRRQSSPERRRRQSSSERRRRQSSSERRRREHTPQRTKRQESPQKKPTDKIRERSESLKYCRNRSPKQKREHASKRCSSSSIERREISPRTNEQKRSLSR